MLIVARSFLRSRCVSVRPRRIVQQLQGFGSVHSLEGLLMKGSFTAAGTDSATNVKMHRP